MRWLDRLVSPYYWSFNAMPNLAILPLIIMWFGFGASSPGSNSACHLLTATVASEML